MHLSSLVPQVRDTPTARRSAAVSLVLLSSVAIASGVGPSVAAAPADPPSLRIFSSQHRVEVTRPKGEPAYVSLPVYATPVGGTLDLRPSRPDYETPVSLTQVVHETDGSTTQRALPDVSTRNWRGLGGFFQVAVTAPDGTVVKSNRAWCPNSYLAQRIEPDSLDHSTFPVMCGGIPFTLGSVWGIDEGWATPAINDYEFFLDGPVGRYTVDVGIKQTYRDLFGVPDDQAETSTVVRVRNGGRAEGLQRGGDTGSARPRAHVRLVDEPPTDQLPDLRSLPAFAISTDNRQGRDYLAFAADVWVAGTSLMDIEGFRREGEEVMDAYQYFYDGEEVVGRAPVGTLEYDTRRGHHHWHLKQFARYRLLDSEQGHVARSKKQSFCLAPTDAIDLSLDGAERNPYQVGLNSACGGRSALWIRETLPIGWGDTYYQSRGGQDFDITNLPNGSYYVSVEANPTGELFETDETNNQSLREVRLKGEPGHRRVCVPAVGLVDGYAACS